MAIGLKESYWRKTPQGRLHQTAAKAQTYEQLRSGSIKWRGIFDKKIVSFNLQDEGFRDQVSSQRVQFQNGTTLVCDFEVLQREDETGEIEITGYAVTKVHEVKTPMGGPGRKVEEQLSLHLHEQSVTRNSGQ